MAFVFDMGIVRIPLQDETGNEFGVAAYNPKDFGILTRAQDASSDLDELTKIFAGFAEEQSQEKALEVMSKACLQLQKYCDFVFGKGFYEGAFSRVNPFTEIANGNWLCVEIITSVLEDMRNKAQANREKAEKYLKGYKKNA